MSNLQETFRPKCSVPGCNHLAVVIRIDKNTGVKKWRRSDWIRKEYPTAKDTWCCSKHHGEYIAKKNGVKSKQHLSALRLGLTITEYNHRNHPYLWYRAEVPYCENIDGRLGFKCNTVLPTQETLAKVGLEHWKPESFLDVDHIDGNSDNNPADGSNFQTLCKHCHMIKSYTCGDHLTPGRKTRISS